MHVRKDIKERFPQTFEDVAAAEVGHVFCDEFENGVRFIILRGPGSLCAYLGLPITHPLAGYDYNDLSVEAHGGLTYSGTDVYGDGETYWYGWDYNHSGDKSTWDLGREGGRSWAGGEHGWTPAEVYSDSWDTKYDFSKIVGMAEKIARKGWQTAGTEPEKVG